MKNKKYIPIEAMPHAESATSPEALSRLKAEKEKQIDYYYFDPRTSTLSKIPPVVDRINLGPRHKDEYLVKAQGGKVIEIRPFRDETILDPETKKNLEKRIKEIL